MKFSMIWPIALVVFSNIFYHVSSKSTPANINPFASLTITYLVASLISLIAFFIFTPGENLLKQYKHINWTTFVLGIAIVGLEAGGIYMYKSGWNISSGQLVYSSLVAICLIAIGCIFYKEPISITRIAGIIVCVIGLFLINKP